MITQCCTKISGVGAYIPKQRILTSELLEAANSISYGTPANYIEKMIGIESVYYSNDTEQPSDMAISASIQAIANSRIKPADIGMIIFCGIDRDWQEPATAHRVQEKIGAINSMCFDVSNACHGFMNGVSIADMYIRSGCIDTALVCTGEKPSEVAKFALQKINANRDKAIFRSSLGSLTTGDAGGAMVIQRSEKNGGGFKSMQFKSIGKHANLCYYKRTDHGIEGQMLMREITMEIARLHSEIIDSTYEMLNWLPRDIDTAVCHQVGAKPHRLLAKTAGIELEKAPVTYKKYGNLTSATIPVIMHFNPPKKGDRLLFLGTGSGLSVCQAGMVF